MPGPEDTPENPPDSAQIFGINPFRIDVRPCPEILDAIKDALMKKRDWGGLWVEPYYPKRSYLAQGAPWPDTGKNGVASNRYSHEGAAIFPLRNSDRHPLSSQH